MLNNNWGLVVGISLGFLFIEWAGMWFFVPCLSRIGMIVKFIKVDFDLNCFEIGKEYETESARFKRVSKNSCLLRHKAWVGQLNTPFFIKSEILRRKAGVFLIWRIPLSAISLYFALLFPWLLGGEFLLFAIFSAAGLILELVSILIERERARVEFFETLDESRRGFAH